MSNYDPNYVYKPSFFVVGTKTILRDNEGKILVMKRSPEGKGVNHGKWSLPGGGLDENENPLTGAKREIREETNLEITNLEVFGVNFRRNNEKPIIIIGYKGNVTNNIEVKLNWEHTEYKFLTKEEALKLDLTEDGKFFIQNS